jgi:predicted RNA-binding Zn ribbon-like protein
MARPAPFELVAGHVALDFANTLDNRYSPAVELELLQSYDDLLRFCAQARIMAPAQVRRLHRLAFLKGTGAVVAALRSALRLREAIERIFSAIAQDGAQDHVQNHDQRHPRRKRTSARGFDANDLAILNGYVKNALVHRRIAPAIASAGAPTIVPNGAPLAWQWIGQGSDLNAPFWPIVLAAAELLASGDLALVRECRSATCRWLFLDQSKNHSRRWCDMKTCGNRVKARRYYHKPRA